MTSKSDKSKKQTVDKKTKEKKLESLFSQKEIKDFVKGFITNYIEGNVRFKFMTASEHQNKAKKDDKYMSYAEASSLEIQSKTDFNALVTICCGTDSSTKEEFEKAISEVFRWILAHRASKRIEGDFTKYSLEKRIEELEKGEKVTKKLVKSLLDDYKDIMETMGDQDGPMP